MNPIRFPFRAVILRAAAFAPVLLAAACGSANPFVENRQALDAANQKLLAGDFAATDSVLQGLVLKTNPEAGRFALQRYFAAYLLSRAQMESALRMTGEQWLPTLVGSTYFMNFAEAWSAAAKASPAADETKEPMLPEALATFGVDNAQAYLNLCWLVVCARLGFQNEVAEVCGAEPRLATVESAEKLSHDLGMTDEARPWLLWSLFQHQKVRDERVAYRFGIRARELGRSVAGSFPAARGDEIVHWIQSESKFVFKSTAGVEFDPKAERCSQTGEPNISFRGSPK